MRAYTRDFAHKLDFAHFGAHFSAMRKRNSGLILADDSAKMLVGGVPSMAVINKKNAKAEAKRQIPRENHAALKKNQLTDVWKPRELAHRPYSWQNDFDEKGGFSAKRPR